MTSNETKTPAATTASAGAPTAAELERLRVGFLACETVTQAVDTAIRWIAATLSTAPPKSGSRVLACVRLARPAGTLRSVQVVVDGTPKDSKLHISRAALASFSARAADVSVRTQPTDPLVMALRGVVDTTKIALAAPVWGVQGLWGLMCVGYGAGEDAERWMQQVARAAARCLSDFLENQKNVLKASVLDANPKAPLDLNSFLARTEHLLAAKPTGDGGREPKPGLAILVYSCGALTDDANARRRWIQTVARAAHGATRDGDFASILGDEAIAFALGEADAGSCGAVAQRMRELLSKHLPEAALGGFAYHCFAPSAPVKVADLARVAEQARTKRILKSS